MNVWTRALLIGTGVTILALIAFSIFGDSNKAGRLLQDRKLVTVRYIIRTDPMKMTSNDDPANTIDMASGILERRLAVAGYTHTVKTTDKQRIDITLSNIEAEDTTYATELLTANSVIEFRELYQVNELAPALISLDSVYRQLANKPPAAIPTPAEAIDTNANTNDDSVLKDFNPQPSLIPGTGLTTDGISSLIQFTTEGYNSPDAAYRYPATIGLAMRKDTAVINRVFHDPGAVKKFPADAQLCYGPVDNNSQGGKDMVNLYIVRTRGYETALLGNGDIATAKADFGRDGQPEISLGFKASGARKWYNMTAQNVNKPVAIIFNGRVVMAPYVNGAIEGGNSTIHGGFTAGEVKTICAQLSAPPIPVIFTIEKKQIDKKGVGNMYRNLLYACIVFIIATGTALFIFKMLKNR